MALHTRNLFQVYFPLYGPIQISFIGTHSTFSNPDRIAPSAPHASLVPAFDLVNSRSTTPLAPLETYNSAWLHLPTSSYIHLPWTHFAPPKMIMPGTRPSDPPPALLAGGRETVNVNLAGSLKKLLLIIHQHTKFLINLLSHEKNDVPFQKWLWVGPQDWAKNFKATYVLGLPDYKSIYGAQKVLSRLINGALLFWFQYKKSSAHVCMKIAVTYTSNKPTFKAIDS